MTKNIPLFKVFMSPEAAGEVAKVLNSGFIGQGPKVEEFEKLLKDRFQIDGLVTVNSGTSAEHLAFHLLKMYGVNEGDEVLTTPLTCLATNAPITLNNLKIKWVDIDPETLNVDLLDLERKISPTTKVIYLTHWGGYPNDLDKVNEIADKAEKLYGFRPFIIEDCAHAFGAAYKGKLIGTHGNINTFSLQAIKHFTTVDGGILVAPKSRPEYTDFYRKAKLLRWYGIDREQERTDFRCESPVILEGFKFHMNDVCAAVGIANLQHVDSVVAAHRSNAEYYDENLKGVKGLSLLKREDGFDSAFWIYSLLVEDRQSFTKWMKECGISVSQVHERNDKNPCFKEFRTLLPTLDATIGHLTHIPVHWGVSLEDREYIVDCIKQGW